MGMRATDDYDLPCAREDRALCGDLDIRIDVRGGWHYNASPIARPEMVRLFASMLKLDAEGRHWLVTPTEMGRICVDDAPFVALDLCATGDGDEQVLCLSTNVDDVVCVADETPLSMKRSPATGDMTPYVSVGDGLEARISRAVYYQLVELGVSMEVDGQNMFGVWSSGAFFVLGPLEDTST